MTSQISQKIAKYAHDYRDKIIQDKTKEIGSAAYRITKYDVADYMVRNNALKPEELKSWIESTTEGKEALNLTQTQLSRLKTGTLFNFTLSMQSYMDSDEVNDLSLGNVLGFEKTTNKKTGATVIKSKAVSKKQYSLADEMKKQSFYNYIKSLPTPQATYTELMRSIEFDKLDKKGKMEMMLKISGEKFNEAKEKGDKKAMKDYLLEGIGMAFQLSCQTIDSAVGITQFKEWAKERSGLNFLVDLIDKYVDDGDDATLSWMAKNWEGVKGFGDALDSFLGTQAIAFMGALSLAGAAAGTGALGKAFNMATKAYFLYDGGKMAVNGTIGYYNAETKQDARAAGQEFGMGSFIFLTTLTSVISDIQTYRASKSGLNIQDGGLPELSDGNKTILKQNLPAIQNQTQVTTDLAFLQQNGVEIVKFSPETGFELNINGKTHVVPPATGSSMSFESGITNITNGIRSAVEGAPSFTSPSNTGLLELQTELKANGTSYEIGTNNNGNTEIRVKTSTVSVLGSERSTFDIHEITSDGQRFPVRQDVSSKGLEKLTNSQIVDNSNAGQANISLLGGLESVASRVVQKAKDVFKPKKSTPAEQTKTNKTPVIPEEAKADGTQIETKANPTEQVNGTSKKYTSYEELYDAVEQRAKIECKKTEAEAQDKLNVTKQEAKQKREAAKNAAKEEYQKQYYALCIEKIGKTTKNLKNYAYNMYISDFQRVV